MTEFIESNALYRAFEDAEADSGNYETTDAYLREQFFPNELRKLAAAADLLAARARIVLREKEGAA